MKRRKATAKAGRVRKSQLTKHMPDDINNPLSNSGNDMPGNPSTGAIPGTTGGTTSNVRENLESSRQHLREAAGNLRTNLEASKGHVKQAAGDLRAAAKTTANELRDRAEHAYSDARERVRTLQDDGEQYVRENPTKAVLTALAAGFVLGLIYRR
jgi:ElaB/YqjD/DUF883 family membrane-anchored ribosome-binding protein